MNIVHFTIIRFNTIQIDNYILNNLMIIAIKIFRYNKFIIPINNLIPENTEGFGGEKPPTEENSTSNAKKTKRETAVSQRLINFALHMYKQLTSEQRYTIFILLQNGTKKKDIAKAINVSPSTISREIKRNSGHNGHYNWETAQRNVV